MLLHLQLKENLRHTATEPVRRRRCVVEAAQGCRWMCSQRMLIGKCIQEASSTGMELIVNLSRS